MVFFLNAEIKGGYLPATNPVPVPTKSPLVSITWTGADFWQYLQIRMRGVDQLRVKLGSNAINHA